MQVLLQSVAAFFVQLSGTIGITKLGSYYKVALQNLSAKSIFLILGKFLGDYPLQGVTSATL